MRKAVLAGLLLFATLWMSSCISVRSEKRTVPSRPPAPKPAPPAPEAPAPVVVEPKEMTIQEIDAIAMLSLESHRMERYVAIARRSDLSEQTQVYLVDTILKRLSLESNRVSTLEVLIANPSFSQAAKSAILDRLGRLSLESHRVEILELLSER